MKKILFGFAFIAAIGGAFASKQLVNPTQSYKLVSGPDQSCHNISLDIPQCSGGSATCTIVLGGRALATYYSDATCATPLKKNP